MPPKLAMVNPNAQVRIVETKKTQNSDVKDISKSLLMTMEKGGKKPELIKPKRGASSQARASNAMPRKLDNLFIFYLPFQTTSS
jgi:hypothetical protein